MAQTSKHGYNYTERLVNNCLISGSYEDMNVWVKVLKNKRVVDTWVSV